MYDTCRCKFLSGKASSVDRRLKVFNSVSFLFWIRVVELILPDGREHKEEFYEDGSEGQNASHQSAAIAMRLEFD